MEPWPHRSVLDDRRISAPLRRTWEIWIGRRDGRKERWQQQRQPQQQQPSKKPTTATTTTTTFKKNNNEMGKSKMSENESPPSSFSLSYGTPSLINRLKFSVFLSVIECLGVIVEFFVILSLLTFFLRLSLQLIGSLLWTLEAPGHGNSPDGQVHPSAVLNLAVSIIGSSLVLIFMIYNHRGLLRGSGLLKSFSLSSLSMIEFRD